MIAPRPSACSPIRNPGPAILSSPATSFLFAPRTAAFSSAAAIPRPRVDLARLAGLDPSGVLCEIVKDDGTMARLPDLLKFKKKHKLKLCTILDLIEYRRRREKLIELEQRVKLRPIMAPSIFFSIAPP